MKPTVRVFSRGNPCTKIDVWNAFRGRKGFVPTTVVRAQSIIGANVPRVLEREGRMVRETIGGKDMYILTPEGEEWLTRGFRNYLRNHPADLEYANFVPPGFAD